MGVVAGGVALPLAIGLNTAFPTVRITNTDLSSLTAPTHPNQVGLAGIGRNRDTYPWPTVFSANVTYTAANAGTTIVDTRFDAEVLFDGTSVATGMTFRRCWFKGSTNYAMRRLSGAAGGPGITVEDSDFGAYGTEGYLAVAGVAFLYGENFFNRCLFHNMEDCFKLKDIHHITDCWLQPVNLPGGHTDCMQYNDADVGKVYVVRSTLDGRTWSVGGVRCHSQEELGGGASLIAYGNAVLQAKPCPPGICTEPLPTCFYSLQDSIITGGNYIATLNNQNGEFLRNIVIRGSGNPATNLGLRNSMNTTIPSSGADVNRFHDNSEIYLGGQPNPAGEADPGPIPLLGL